MSEGELSALATLSEREQEILHLIGAGYSNGDIAERLHLSLGTVKWYNTQIFQKLGVRSRSQAMALLHEESASRPDRDMPDGASPSAPPAALAAALPSQPMPFVGRDDELRRAAALLAAPDCRLLTFVGPGGIGKTRLALEVASREGGRFRHGAWFVPLAALASPDEIDRAIATALDIPLGNEASDVDVRRQLLDYLKPRQLLLALDNFDGFLNGAGQLSDLLQAAPGVKALVTSRERLNLQEETVLRLDGLPVSEAASADEAPAGAAALLLAHVRRVRPDFALTGENAADVVRICRLVEGMPLGIILAAAWADVLSLAEIAEEIACSLDFLQADIRNLPERHRSMRSVFDSTWKLLAPEERVAFARLSIFCGGFTRAAAQAVAGADLRSLMMLVNKSLVIRHDDGRFDLHELLRQYATEKLADLGQETALARAHAAYFLGLLTAPENADPERDAALEDDFDNIRLAWERAAQSGALDRIAGAMGRWREHCLRHRRYQEALRAIDLALDAAERWPTRAEDGAGLDPTLLALHLRECRGSIRSLLGQFGGAIQDLQQVRQAAYQMGEFSLERHALVLLGQVYRKTEMHNEAQHALLEVVRRSRSSGDRRDLADALYHLGTIAWDEGRANDAYESHAEAVRVVESLGARDVVAVQAWHGMGEAFLSKAWPVRAAESFTRSLDMARAIGDTGYEQENLQMLGWVHSGTVGRGDYVTANAAFAESLAIADAAQLIWHRVCSLSGYGLVLASVGDYRAGVDMVIEGIDAAVLLGVTRFACLALDCAGQIYQDLGLFEPSSAYLRRGIDLSLRSESAFWLPRMQANLAINQLRQGDLSVGDDLLAALDLATSRGLDFHALRCQEGLIELAIARGEFAKAQTRAEALSDLATQRQLNEIAVQARRWRGEALWRLGALDEAERELQHGAALADGIGRHRLIMDVQTALARFYEARRDPARALHHAERAEQVSASMRSFAGVG